MKYKIPSWSLAALACLIWSTAFVGVKYALGFSEPLFIAGIRFTLAGLVLFPFAAKGFFREFRDHYKIILIVALLQTFLVYAFYFLALERIKASTGASLVGLGPMVGALMGHFFVKDDRLTIWKGISFILGIIGVTLVSLGGGENGGLPGINEIIGIILFILNVLTGALSSLLVLRYKGSVRSDVLTSSQLFIGGISLYIVSLFLYKDLTFMLPAQFYLALIWLTFVSAAGFSLWYYLLAKRREKLTNMNIWKFIMPVTGGIFSWIIFPNDSPNIFTIAGMITVAISVLVFYSKSRVK